MELHPTRVCGDHYFLSYRDQVATGLNNYHWSALPMALCVLAIALAARRAIASKLGDRTKRA